MINREQYWNKRKAIYWILLQAYRIRMGNFNPTIRIKNSKEQVRSCNKDFKWNYLVIIVLLVSFIPWPVTMPYCTSQEGTRSIILKPPWTFPSSASPRTFPSSLPLFCRRSRSPCSLSTISASPLMENQVDKASPLLEYHTFSPPLPEENQITYNYNPLDHTTMA